MYIGTNNGFFLILILCFADFSIQNTHIFDVTPLGMCACLYVCVYVRVCARLCACANLCLSVIFISRVAYSLHAT